MDLRRSQGYDIGGDGWERRRAEHNVNIVFKYEILKD